MKFLIAIVIFLFSFFGNAFLHSQNDIASSDYVIIDKIEAEGHKKTRMDFILRELSFQLGDTIWQKNLQTEFDKSRDNLINTNIFNKADFESFELDEDRVKVLISLEERIRFYPIPLLEVADQNYNVWLKQHNADLNRLVYGLYFSVYNLRGKGEYLITESLFGYRTYLNATYVFPYIDKKKKLGLAIKGLYRRDRQIPVSSFENILQYFPPDTVDDIPKEPLARRFAFNVKLKHRQGLDKLQYFQIGFQHIEVDQELIETNSEFFKDGARQQDFFLMAYTFERDFRDIDNYSLSGSYVQLSVIKRGLGIFKDINTLSFEGNFSNYFDLGKHLYWGVNLKGRKDFGKQIPYFNNNRIGFASNYLRGYENNIIDNQQYLFLRTDMKYRFLKLIFNNPLKKKVKGKYPIYGFCRVFLESAFVKDTYYAQDNPLNNGTLAGAGLALDFVLSENIPITFEYTLNKEGEAGFYFHFGIGWDYGILFR